MLGTAWPSMRHTFHQPLGSLGLILLFGTCGNLVTSLSTGRTLRRFGVGRLPYVAGLIAAAGALLIAAASVWAMVLVGALLIGMTAGLLDTGLNTVVALSGRLRLLNLLHGAYGVGSGYRPSRGDRCNFVHIVAAGVLLVDCVGTSARVWLVANKFTVGAGRGGRRRGRCGSCLGRRPDTACRPLGRPRGGCLFLLHGPRSHGRAMGGEFLSWANRIVGRRCRTCRLRVLGIVDGGTVRHRHSAPDTEPGATRARVGCVGGLAASAVIWWAPLNGGGHCRIRVAGCGPRAGLSRAGDVDAACGSVPPEHDAIGWQIAGANVGSGGLSAFTGLILQHEGLRTLGPCLVVIAIVLIGCNVALEFLSRR